MLKILNIMLITSFFTFAGCSKQVSDVRIKIEADSADIYIDGKYYGDSKYSFDHRLEVGEYKVEAVKLSFTDDGEFEAKYAEKIISVEGEYPHEFTIPLKKSNLHTKFVEKFWYGRLKEFFVGVEKYLDRYPNGKNAVKLKQLREKLIKKSFPEMVSIPGGDFEMGCVSGIECEDDEKPIHVVNIKPFKIGKYELTFNQFDICYLDGGCNTYIDFDGDRGDATSPAVNVTKRDCAEYSAWLSKRMKKYYSMPSEAMWEYAARAGSKTKYSWGNDVGSNNANCNGCGSKWDDKWPAPIGTFKPNSWGVYDMHGNVKEWVADKYHENYDGAPTDGSVWWKIPRYIGDIYRGGSFKTNHDKVRSSSRQDNIEPGYLLDDLGCRLVTRDQDYKE